MEDPRGKKTPSDHCLGELLHFKGLGTHRGPGVVAPPGPPPSGRASPEL